MFKRLAEGTRTQYARGLRYFASFAEETLSLEPASWWTTILTVVGRGPLVTGDLADRYLASLTGTLAPATVAQRAAAIRWVLSFLREVRAIDWSVRIRGPKPTPYRDTRGPSLAEVRQLLDVAARQPLPRGPRDVALLELLFVLALRRGEVAALRLVHWDSEARRLTILGKMRDDTEIIWVPDGVAAALAAYLDLRGPLAPDAPLIAGHGPRNNGAALSTEGIFRALRRLSQRAKLTRLVRPHGLRHAGITAALDRFDGDVRKVARFARHAKLETTLAYDDRRRDHAGEVATGLSDLLRDS